MKIALIGYGKMGKVIDRLAIDKGHEIVLRINERVQANNEALLKADVAIEFSTPESAAANIYACFEAGIPVVVGTTGWYDQFPNIEDQCKANNHTLFYATNFSVGVNIFFELNRYLSRMMNRFDNYTPKMLEIHHTEKLDAPSGTAITLAEDLIYEMDRLKGWKNEEVWDDDRLSILSERKPDVPGTHRVEYESAIDSIAIRHEAKGREGFASGAIAAAEWVAGKQGVFTMKDLLKIQ